MSCQDNTLKSENKKFFWPPNLLPGLTHIGSRKVLSDVKQVTVFIGYYAFKAGYYKGQEVNMCAYHKWLAINGNHKLTAHIGSGIRTYIVEKIEATLRYMIITWSLLLNNW